jgi:hypothetical protein
MTDRTPTSEELDLKRRLNADASSPKPVLAPPVLTSPAAPYASEGMDTDGYIGVSQEYQNYASETERPMRAEGGVEAEAEQRFVDSYATSVPEGATSKIVEDENEGSDSEGLSTPEGHADAADPHAQGGEAVNNPQGASGNDAPHPQPPSVKGNNS